jgi:hypothetical protein
VAAATGAVVISIQTVRQTEGVTATNDLLP